MHLCSFLLILTHAKRGLKVGLQRCLTRSARPLHAIASDVFFTLAVSLAAAVISLALVDDIEQFVYQLRTMQFPAALPAPAVIG